MIQVPETSNTDTTIAEIGARAIEKAADDLAGENNIGGYENEAMHAYAAQSAR